MSKMQIKILDCTTGEEVLRDMTEEEFANWQSANATVEAQTQAVNEAATAKTALLEKLGITEDEARLLLGGN